MERFSRGLSMNVELSGSTGTDLTAVGSSGKQSEKQSLLIEYYWILYEASLSLFLICSWLHKSAEIKLPAYPE